MLEAALQSQHTDPQRFEPERTNLIHIRDKVAERAMNWMLVVRLDYALCCMTNLTSCYTL